MNDTHKGLRAYLNEIKEVIPAIEDIASEFDEILEEYNLDDDLKEVLEELNARIWRLL